MDNRPHRSRSSPLTGSDTPIAASFGEAVRRFRVALGLTQEELAERSTISLRAISDIERGVKRRPQRETVRLLSEALALSETDRAIFAAAARPRAQSADPPPIPADNLFAPVTPLVGREREVAALTALLSRSDVRLVTITGCGGVGKTRLSVDVAADLRGAFADGVVFVSLATIRDSEQVAAAIVGALGLKERAGESPRACLTAQLRDRQLLMVLDNFEHVIEEALLVAELLAACPALKILVTSREALRLRGEHDFALAPLPLPDPEQWENLSALVGSPAVEMFCQRAQAAMYDFALTAKNAAAIAAICARVDGLPLAIELAAARVRFFGPDLLLARLAALLPELTDGPRDAPARQRTMQNAIDWSYRALDDAERMLFAQMAVFIGGCTLEAAEAVCMMDGSRDTVLRGVMSLVAKNLLRQSGGAAPRVGMLETIREYGLEALAGRGDAATVRQRHAVHFLALAERAEPELTGPEQAGWSARLLAEHDNLRAALRWAAAEGEAEIGLRLAAALWRFWEARGYLTEAREWLTRMLAVGASGGDAPTTVRTRALNGASMLAYRQGDYAEAVRLSEESLALSRSHENRAAMAEALGNLGFIAHRRGDNARAVPLIQESLALGRDTGDLLSIATALNRLGIIESALGNHDRAVACYEECLALHRRRGHQRNIGNALDNLGCAMRRRGDYASAVARSGESLAVFRALGDDWGIANALLNLADTARDRGDNADALRRYKEGLTHYRRVGNTLGIIECLEGAGRVSIAQGAVPAGVRLLAAGASLREAIGTPVWPPDRPAYDEALTVARSTIGIASFAAAWAAGAVLSMEEAIAEAAKSALPLAQAARSPL